MTEVIIQVLKAVDIYDAAREKFNTDEELAETFHQDFDRLIAMFAAG